MNFISIEAMTAEHWEQVRSIYLQGIATGNATFQQSAPDWHEWDEGHLPGCRMVAKTDPVLDARIVGWAALSPVSRRFVYAGVAEVSVYVAEKVRGQRIGVTLLGALVAASEAAGIWTLQAGIFPENPASIRLHKGAGFREVGTRVRIGCMNGRWRDVLLLERRSSVVGAEQA